MVKVFIHGLGQTSESWIEVVTYLNCVNNNSPDLKTLLRSKEVTFDNLYEVFSEYCDEISDKLDLCGISLGGMIAIKYAFNNPDKVNSLVLIGTQYKIPKLLFTLQGIVFRCLPNSVFNDIEFTKDNFITLTNSMKSIDFSKEISQIECETLVICGINDYANKKATNNLHLLLKKSNIYFVPNCKHEVNTQKPKELSEILSKFYSNI